MKLAFICDLHLSNIETSAQAYYLSQAVHQMKSDGIKTVITLGDVSAYGEISAHKYYRDMFTGFKHYILLGNSDVRDPFTSETILASTDPCCIHIENRTILGLHNPYPRLSEADRIQINTLKDGDVLALHHTINALEQESKEYLISTLETHQLTVFTAHHHRYVDQTIGQSRVITLPALDPDKVIDQFPTITYVDISSNSIYIEQMQLKLPISIMHNIKNSFGISCVDNRTDIMYALENRVGAAELRCNGSDWFPEMDLVPLLEQWHTQTHGYLSVHMPNLRWKNNQIVGLEQWKQAVEYAKIVGADGITVHPPYISRCDMIKDSTAWISFLKIYTESFTEFSPNVQIGIENLHLMPNEPDDENSRFGCTPPEIANWIDTINEALGIPNRVGHTLDVGHARNNGKISERYPISRWYEIMGSRIRAFHIHQVTRKENQLQNHQPIENWFGPMISYVSFFYCWDKHIINHKPIFLEVQGSKHYQTSIHAFNKQFP